MRCLDQQAINNFLRLGLLPWQPL